MKPNTTPYDVLEERIRGMETALRLQAAEYERRLDGLNGEAGHLRDIQAEYIPREVFDRTIGGLNDKIQILTDYKNAQEGKSQLTKYIPWAIAIVFGVLAYYKR